MTEAFSRAVINKKYKKIKFHLLLSFRLMTEKMPMPQYNSHKVQEYCDHICEILSDNERCKLAFEAAMKMVDSVLGRDPVDRDSMDRMFTDRLMQLSRQIAQKRASK